MFLDPKDIKMDSYRESAFSRGYYPGFDSLYEIMSMKPGYPIFIAGDPGSGKTEFVLELLISAAEMYGHKSAIYLGETGTVEDIIAELCSKYISKPFKKYYEEGKESIYAMSDKERYSAEAWVAEHFKILDTKGSYTIEKFHREIREAEIAYGLKFNYTLFDPVVDIHGWQQSADYLLPVLKTICDESLNYNRTDIIVNHIGDTDKIKHGVDKMKRIKVPALPDEWAGGKSFFRRAFQMLLVFRPPAGAGDNGAFAEENETWIQCQKSKPKGVGRIGQAKLFWDFKRNRFYEKNYINQECYSGEIYRGVKARGGESAKENRHDEKANHSAF